MTTTSRKRRSAADDWTNTVTGLGSVHDKAKAVEFVRRSRVDRATLESLYEQSAIVARVVDLLADDCFRNGWEITGLPDDVDLPMVMSKIDDLGVNAALRQAVKWSRLYGGALFTLPALDGRSPDQPLDLSKVAGLFAPVVIPAHDASPLETDAGFGSSTYRKVLMWQVQNIGAGNMFDVHHSRVIPFEAVELPPDAALRSGNGWGPSVIERIMASLSRYGTAHAFAAAQMYIGSILTLQLDGFRRQHASKDGKEQIRQFLSDVKCQLDATGILGLDSADTLASVQHSAAGTHDLLDRFAKALGADLDMPREIAFNESPAGLNAGELTGPQELWFAKVSAYQTNVLTPVLDRVLQVLFAALKIRCDEWQIVWKPLWTRTDTSKAAIAAQNATADSAYINLGVLSADEVRAHRFEQGKLGPVELAVEEPVTPFDLSAEVEAEEEAIAAAVEPVAATVDVAGLTAIVEKVAAGTLPRDAAFEIIKLAWPHLADRAPGILGSAGVEQLTSVVPPTAGPDAGPEGDAAELGPPPSDDPLPEDLASPRDAAAKFGVPTRTITLAIERGALRYWGLGSHKRVSLAEVAKLARSHETAAE